MTELPQAVADLVADLGHGPLQSRDSFTISYVCPTCGACANFDINGWTGWAVEETCERVLRVTGSSPSGGSDA